ncbi:MAG: HU family DNA-binding protein [Tannerellaceae bacterium]|nr:HU family DNA-binding protein [Tannerellaceae bacterium]
MEYTLQQRMITVGPDKGLVKWRPVFRHRGRTSYEELVEKAQKSSFLMKGEVVAVFRILQEIIVEELRQGRTVQLDKLGWLNLSATTTGNIDPNTFTGRQVNRIHIRFRPSPQLKTTLQHIKVTRSRK